MHFNEQVEEEIEPGFWIGRGQLIGNGNFGVVLKAKIVSADNSVLECCVKILNLQGSNAKKRKQQELEKSILIQLKDLENPNLVKVYHVVEKKNEMFLFMEECNQGDLKQYLFTLSQEQQPRLEEGVKYIGQILNGMKTLIDQNIVHRDLKPQNILVHDGVLKLTDFGMGTILEDSLTFQMVSSVGSPLYSAPQILFGKPYTSKSDVFSLGVMLYELIYGRPPFEASFINHLKSQLNNLQHKPLKCPLESQHLADPAVPNDLRMLIEQMIVYDEEKRIGWPELFAHQRFSQFITQKSIRIPTNPPPSTPKTTKNGKQKIQLITDDISTCPNSTQSSNETNDSFKSPVEQTEKEEQKNNRQLLTNDQNQKPNNLKQSGEAQQQQPQALAPIRLLKTKTDYIPGNSNNSIPTSTNHQATDKQQQKPAIKIKTITLYSKGNQGSFRETITLLEQNTVSLQDSFFSPNSLYVEQPGQGKMEHVYKIWRITSYLIQKSELAWQTVQQIGQFKCTKDLNNETNWQLLLYGLVGYRLYLLYTCYGLTSNIPCEVSPSLFPTYPLEKLSLAMAQFSQSNEHKFVDLREQIRDSFADTLQLYKNQTRDVVQYFQFALEERSTYAYYLICQNIRDFFPFYQLFWYQYRNFYRQRLQIQQNVIYPAEYLQMIYALEKLFAIEHLFPTRDYKNGNLDNIILTPPDDRLVDEILGMRSRFI